MSEIFETIMKAQAAAGVVPAERAGTQDGGAGGADEARLRRRAYELEFIAQSGLFDQDYYLGQYPDTARAGMSALEHFFDFGHREGRRPNPYFDPKWYLARNPDVRESGAHPLTHYLSYGDIEGRRPSSLFDPAWYRKRYGVGEGEIALAHYLGQRTSGRVAPIPEFDIELYARSYPDVIAAGIDPFDHFVHYGYREGRSPSADFDCKFYAARYLGGDMSRNPFLHYLEHRHEPGVYGRMPPEEATIPREVRRFTRPAPEFEEFVPLPPSAARRAKLLAYYLPQFHAVAENDAWWGRGFTEWTNVPRGLPRFRGHYQPRIPRDLGFYSLHHAGTLRRQVDLAKAGGVFGFVFYYYWFNGKRLLDKPLEMLLADASIDMPFCLMWANENWTRRWDGADSEVLISQDYRPADEAPMIADFARHFADPRYIRIGGRPVLMVYRPGLIPDGGIGVARWRRRFQDAHGENPILVMAQTFRAADPSAFGMDGAIEFPPHKLTQDMPSISPSLELLDIEFEGKAYRYDDIVGASLDEPHPAFPLIKTAVPGWDNDARRQGNGLVLTESTPQKYQAWLGTLADRAREHPFFGEPFVCVNAWNEWCEAAYLEPDVHFGAAYLNATGRAMVGRAELPFEGRVLLVGHDAFPAGAQHLLLNIGRTLRARFGVDVSVLLLGGGKMADDYAELGPLKIAADAAALEKHCWSLREAGYTSALVNSSAAAAAVAPLTKVGMEVILLVHELPRILREKNLSAAARIGAQLAGTVVFPAPFVRDQFCAETGLERTEALAIIPQGRYGRIEPTATDRAAVRSALGVGKGERLVLGIGYADLRKGFDLFLQVWRLLRARGRDERGPVTHFCWVGDIDPSLEQYMRDELADARADGTFHLPGYRTDMSAWLSGADAFVLTSREDPFPSVVLDALCAGLPTLAFERTGGIPDLLRGQALGRVVPYADTVAMAAAVAAAVRKAPGAAARAAAQNLIARDFDFPAYVWKLLRLLHEDLPEISVAVPNYNYAHHLPARLASVFVQIQPVKEVLLLDDCSTDDSAAVIRATAAQWGRHVRILQNRRNSGSVFHQWRKAAQEATGELLWIAEADDLCSPQLLARVSALIRHDPQVAFAFSDSAAIDGAGAPLWPDHRGYYAGAVLAQAGHAGAAPLALTRTEVFEAADFAARCLSVKNLIVNVSAVVWRRESLLRAMDACAADLAGFTMAGDWRLYLQALSVPGARVGFCDEPLNTHRRHAASVTHGLATGRHLAEIGACQRFAAATFGAGPALRSAQAAYLREVRGQLASRRPARSPKRIR